MARQSFIDIKKALTKAAVLVSLDFSKDLVIFSFAFEHTVVGVLLQKNDQNEEQPIAFYSKVFRDVSLKYNIIEKQAYAIIKALKYLRVYILQSHTVAYVLMIVVDSVRSKRKKS